MDEQAVREAHLRLDALDASGFAAHFTPRGSLRLGNRTPAHGRDRIQGVMRSVFELVVRAQHRLLALWPIPFGVVVESENAYWVSGTAAPVMVLCSSVWKGMDNQFDEAHLYLDLAPLYAAAQLHRRPELSARPLQLVSHEREATGGAFYIPFNNGGRITEVVYSLSPDGRRAVLELTRFTGAVEGVALTSQVVSEIVRWARESGIALIPLCPNVRAVFDLEPAYWDVLWFVPDAQDAQDDAHAP